MRTIELSTLPLALATCLVVSGCDGEIRPPKAQAGGDAVPAAGGDPAAQPAPGAPAAPGAPSEGDARLIGALSSGELIEVCRTSHANLARALAAQVRIECTAASTGANTGACEAARDKCVSENMPDAPEDEAACEMEAPTLAQDCATVSIAALRTCEEAWIRKLEGAAAQLHCGSSLEQIRALSDPSAPSECQNVDTRCSDQ